MFENFQALLTVLCDILASGPCNPVRNKHLFRNRDTVIEARALPTEQSGPIPTLLLDQHIWYHAYVLTKHAGQRKQGDVRANIFVNSNGERLGVSRGQRDLPNLQATQATLIDIVAEECLLADRILRNVGVLKIRRLCKRFVSSVCR